MIRATADPNGISRDKEVQTDTMGATDMLRVKSRSPSKARASTYDALDYRLMATFPASDAVAKY